MGRCGKSLRAIVGEITKSSDRSPLFWWLLEHHDEIADAASGRRMQWATLCARFAEAGLTDTTGKPATPNTAKVTWQRVRRAVAQQRARRATKAANPKRVGATPPSRIPYGWRPEEVIASSAQPPGSVPTNTSAVPAPVSRTTGVPATVDQTDMDPNFEKEFQAWLRTYRINIPPDASAHVWAEYRNAFRDFHHKDRFLRLSQ